MCKATARERSEGPGINPSPSGRSVAVTTSTTTRRDLNMTIEHETPVLTRQDKNLAIAALRHAAATNRPLAVGQPWHGADQVCSCVVIAEALGMPEAEKPLGFDLMDFDAKAKAASVLYDALDARGIVHERVYQMNDRPAYFNGGRGFSAAVYAVQTMRASDGDQVIAAAEQLTYEAAMKMVLS